MSENNNLREQFLRQGAQLIQYELDEQASFSVQLQQSKELKNIDLLSDSIVLNKNLHKEIKEKIKEYQSNIEKILLATASFIEEEKFKSVDMAVSNIQLGLSDKNRLISLVNAQKKLSFSYGTLISVIEIFKLANDIIISEINNEGVADNTKKRLNKTALYLKNAIVVYELTSFVLNYLTASSLQGIDDIKKIKDDVFEDIYNSKISDETLKDKAIKKGSDYMRERTLSEIEQREKIRERTKEKWDLMFNQINEQSSKVGEVKKLINDLEIARDNAKNRVDILNITATTILVEDSLDVIGKLASNIQDWALPPFDEKIACELLNLSI